MENTRQNQLRNEVLRDILNWEKDTLGLQEPLYHKYEADTGKSALYWHSQQADDGDWYHDTLPRPEDYETNGDTEEYVKWVSAIVAKIIAEGANTREAVAEKIKEICEVRQ